MSYAHLITSLALLIAPLSGASAEESDDYPNDPVLGTHVVADGSITSGVLNYESDQDCFRVALQESSAYAVEIRFTGSDNSQRVGVYVDYLWSPTLWVHTPGVWSTLLWFAQPGSGADHYLTVHGTASVNYEFRVLLLSSLGPDESKSCDTAPTISTGATVSGYIFPAEDVDCYTFPAEANHRYRIQAVLSFDLSELISANAIAFSAAVFPPQGGSSPVGSFPGDPNSIFLATQTGLYQIVASAWGGRTGYYELTITDLGPLNPEYGDDRESAIPMVADGTVASGAVNYAGDRDYFRVALDGARLYEVAIRLTGPEINTVASATLENGASSVFYGSISSDSNEWVSLRSFIPGGAGGDYYLRIGGGLETGNYEVRIVPLDVPGKDESESCETAPSITVGSAVSGYIYPALDSDCFSFYAEANHWYKLEVNGSNQFHGLAKVFLPDHSMVLADAHFQSNSYDTPSFTTSQARMYRLVISASSEDNQATGYYEVTIVDLGAFEDDYGNYWATAASLTPDGTVVGGTINYAHDFDYFCFDATGGTLLAVDIRKTEPDTISWVQAGLELYPGGNPATYVSATSTDWQRLTYRLSRGTPWWLPPGSPSRCCVAIQGAAPYSGFVGGGYELRAVVLEAGQPGIVQPPTGPGGSNVSGPDDDSDGVPNATDACPDTPPRSFVDSTGCMPPCIIPGPEGDPGEGLGNQGNTLNSDAASKLLPPSCGAGLAPAMLFSLCGMMLLRSGRRWMD